MLLFTTDTDIDIDIDIDIESPIGDAVVEAQYSPPPPPPPITTELHGVVLLLVIPVPHIAQQLKPLNQTKQNKTNTLLH